MSSLNYHHFRLFRAVAKEGNLTRAAKKLGLTPQTVSTQIKNLEASLGESLFERVGRQMHLSDVGRVALDYADAIFALGDEFQETLRGQFTDGRSIQLRVGVNDILPKHIVHHLVEPALHLHTPVHMTCQGGNHQELLGALALHQIDVVLTDSPIAPRSTIRAYNQALGGCGVTFLAVPTLARVLRPEFPRSLDRAPTLLPTSESNVRRDLDNWFSKMKVVPHIVAEFQDSALLKIFGQAGEGFFAVPSVVALEVSRQYGVEEIGTTEDIEERFFAISAERRVRHPAVAAICDMARVEFFG